jgi:FkbM family methyltransferase
MLRKAKAVVRNILNATPYSIKKNIPAPTFNAVRFGLAHFISHSPKGVIVQIGAYDGVSGDPVYEFVHQGRLRAVLVEPIESSFLKLQETYSGIDRVSLVPAAIAHQDGKAKMYRAKNSGRWLNDNWVGRVTSFDRKHLLRHGVRKSEIEEVYVEAITLKTLTARFDIDSPWFLQIDAEGFDAEVAEMALSLSCLPDFINFEHANLSPKSVRSVFDKLQAAGYAWLHSSVDTLAIHKRITNRFSS